MLNQRSFEDNRLPVQLQCVEGERVSKTSLSVHCPRSEHFVPLEECVGCEHCKQIVLDGALEDGFLRCSVSAGSRPSNETGTSALDQTPVVAAMPRTMTCVYPELELSTLRMLFLDAAVAAFAVVDDDGRALGVISLRDLLRSECGAESSSVVGAPALTVRDVMTPMAFTLPESASLAKAAALMAFEGVLQVPVTGVDQRVVGIISSLDVMRWLASSTGYVVG